MTAIEGWIDGSHEEGLRDDPDDDFDASDTSQRDFGEALRDGDD